MSRIHRLKTLPEFWEGVKEGIKTFEIRENDRGFQKGDQLRLIKYVPNKPWANVEVISCRVSYVLSGWGLKNGYVCLGLTDIEEEG